MLIIQFNRTYSGQRPHWGDFSLGHTWLSVAWCSHMVAALFSVVSSYIYKFKITKLDFLVKLWITLCHCLLQWRHRTQPNTQLGMSQPTFTRRFVWSKWENCGFPERVNYAMTSCDMRGTQAVFATCGCQPKTTEAVFEQEPELINDLMMPLDVLQLDVGMCCLCVHV